ncbi:FeoB-associated Cys-rich membrane protein [Aequorivita vladivostokensis]|uniref:Adenylosuccinate synthetase n=1 Tax=Aequorivita vladivostokensis TaxID=171194 RepID=A0ABR5DH95_9FLAO|nr:FeoB-associated Cys-rich membrane protein [Aequorivita vladivostokensis]KJJ38181.1 hypothetical protein MB09_10965 [Aequorivita vladivostokensis]
MNKFLFFAFQLIFALGYAQKPTEVPKPSERPIDITDPADIIIYIILPLCAVVFFLIWRSKRKKRKE